MYAETKDNSRGCVGGNAPKAKRIIMSQSVLPKLGEKKATPPASELVKKTAPLHSQ